MGKGRAPCCDKSQVKRGPWSTTEDLRLITFIQKHGHDNWRSLPKQAGLQRCGKSCRLRWINYLRPDVKRGHFTSEEEDAIIKLHESLGNKWSKIASKFPGRTDNEIKNVWNTHLKKRLSQNEKNNVNFAMQSSSSSSSSFKSSCDDQNIGMDHQTSEVTNAIEVINNNETKDISYESPLEYDFDFWSMLELDTPIGPFQANNEAQETDHNISNFGHEKFNLEVESMKWLRSLEYELGLEATTRDDHAQEIAFNDAIDEEPQEVEDFGNEGEGLIKQELDHVTGMTNVQLRPSSPFVI